MTITVTPQPGNLPPRFQITIATPAGQAMTAVALYRTANGSTVPTRVQPSTGAASVIVYDSESPREVGVVYFATVTYGTTTETYTAAAATLTPPFPVLTHPTTPALSMLLDQMSFDAMGVVAIGAEHRAALTNKHRVIGAEYEVVTKVGPRAAPTLTLTIATVTSVERAALIALLRDQTPLFISVPSAWGWDWDDGYYDVGDYDLDRFEQYGGTRRRTAQLNLERVEAPAGTQQAQRTWANVLAQNASWAAVAAGYATWTDLLTNTKR